MVKKKYVTTTKNKKAVSEVLATVLIVLLVIAALVIVSVVLFQFIRKQSQEITAGCIEIGISITKAEYNSTSNITIVYVKRDTGDAELIGMKFIFDGKEKTPSEESDDAALKILETGKYVFAGTETKPKKIEIAPIIKTEADKEMNCGVKTSIKEKDIIEKAISSQPSPPAQQFQDIRTGLVAEWKLDEASGTTATDSQGSNHGTLINGPLWIVGKRGNALQFDGVNDYVDLGSASVALTNGLSAVTWGAWIYAKGIDTRQGASAIISRWQWPNTHVILTVDINKKVSFSSNWPAAYWGGDTTGSPISFNTWHYVAVVYNGSGSANADRLKIYVDSILQPLSYRGTITSVLNSPSTPNYAIGRNMDANPWEFWWNGLIDEVRVYNRALSASEISQLYQFYQRQ